MSPRTGLGIRVSVFVTMFWLSIVPVTLNLPIAVNDTSVPPFPFLAFALFCIAPCRNPCGVSQIWSWRSSAAATAGWGALPGWFHDTGFHQILILPCGGIKAVVVV